MRWEELTDADLAKAARETGVCIVPIGCLERHGNHLPLGTDAIAAHAVAALAAAREPAVVFPPHVFGQINEARHFPGAVTLPPQLLDELLEAVCDEIGRNGFAKIVLYNCHGGNANWLRYFVQNALNARKPYTLYLTGWLATPQAREAIKQLCPTGGEHAHEEETCLMLGIAPHLVKMDRVPDKPSEPLGRLKHLNGPYTAIWWYADHPEHYAGDARSATEEKGRQVLEIHVAALAEVLGQIKRDDVTPALEREFFGRVDGVGAPPTEAAD